MTDERLAVAGVRHPRGDADPRTKPLLTPVSDNANALALPPASELQTNHRSRRMDVPTMTLASSSSSPSDSAVSAARICTSIQPTDVGSDFSGIARKLLDKLLFLDRGDGGDAAGKGGITRDPLKCRGPWVLIVLKRRNRHLVH